MEASFEMLIKTAFINELELFRAIFAEHVIVPILSHIRIL